MEGTQITYTLIAAGEEEINASDDWTEICICHGTAFPDRMALLEHQVGHTSQVNATLQAENTTMREKWATRMLVPETDIMKILKEEDGIIHSLLKQRERQAKQEKRLDRQKFLFDQDVGRFYATRDRIKAELKQRQEALDCREATLGEAETTTE